MTTAIQPLGSLAGLTCDINADLRGANDDLHALRTLLVADVARRLIETFLDGQATLSANDDHRYAQVRLAADALWIPAPDARWKLTDPTCTTPATANVRVTIIHLAGPGDRPAYVVGPVDSPAGSIETLLHEWDPLDVRLALLRFPHAQAAQVTKARLYRAQDTLTRWRTKVAQWSHMPSARPIEIAPYLEPLVEDLGTSSTLLALHHLEVDHNIASGSKLETFLRIDRVLALDLPKVIGRI
jgi:hypothetical protein